MRGSGAHLHSPSPFRAFAAAGAPIGVAALPTPATPAPPPSFRDALAQTTAEGDEQGFVAGDGI
jgi:hypothetical protein